jgi:hypothetical protein
MPLPFIKLAMTSPERQKVFRRLVVFHIVLLTAVGFAAQVMPGAPLSNLGHAAILASIIEGAGLIGWRLAQIPKSQSLEFLLVSPVQPRRVFVAEAISGIGRLALVTLSGLPVLLLMTWGGKLYLSDLLPMTALPFLWGCITGLGLAVWAYESLGLRRWGERLMLVLIVVYLVVGVLAAERLSSWISVLPWQLGDATYRAIFVCAQFNPFGVLEYWLSPERNADIAEERMTIVLAGSLGFAILLLTRGAFRLKGHFQDLHYRPIDSRRGDESKYIGSRPLAWWTVRRVMKYSGRMNLWLAGGFGLLYAAYIMLADVWPVWMGKMVFEIFERMGGVPAISTGLTVLAAVPAAFQYGLWDASAEDRGRRLELLLLTDLDATDYWGAALSAAWRRGRGYFLTAVILWMAMGVSGRASPTQLVMAAAAGCVLWAFSFAVGFRAFSRGAQANGMGTLLTIGFPLLAGCLIALRIPVLPAILPPGAVYLALARPPSIWWLPGPIIAAVLTAVIAISARQHCLVHLRNWLDQSQSNRTVR